MHPSRRAFLAGAGLAPLIVPLLQRATSPAHAEEGGLIRRAIPSSGETLPAMGIGTSRRYEVEPIPETIAPLREAVQRFVALGGSVIDTAPSYGTAEDVLGQILSQDGPAREGVPLQQGRDTGPRGRRGRDRTLLPPHGDRQDRPRGGPQPQRYGNEPRHVA